MTGTGNRKRPERRGGEGDTPVRATEAGLITT